MSIKEISRVWEDSNQSGNRLLIMLALADYADDNGYSWPSIETLARKTRMSSRTVLRAIDDLTAENELYAIRSRNSGNKYIILTGCTNHEKAQRIKAISDKLSISVTTCHLISDTAMSLDPSRSIKDPSTCDNTSTPSKNGSKSSEWIFTLYLEIFKEAVTSGEHDALKDLAEIYAPADVKEAFKITRSKDVRQRITRKVAYSAGILKDWAANGKPHIVAENTSTPITPKKVYR